MPVQAAGRLRRFGPPKLLGQAWLHGPPPAGLAPLGVKERCVPPKPPVVFPKVTS